MQAVAKRCIGLVRVSALRGRGGPSFISPEVQREKVELGVAARGGQVVDWVEELDRPGDRHRHGLEAAIQRVEMGFADGIAVMKLNRLGRDVIGLYETVERCARPAARC